MLNAGPLRSRRERIRPDMASILDQSSRDRATTATDRNIVVTAGAGTGKTTLLSAAREAWEKAGYQVYGAALAAKAARGLQEGSGIASDTLTKRLSELQLGPLDAAKHHAKQLLRAAQGKGTYAYVPFRLDPKSILVVDEAGMIGTRMMARLVEAVRQAGFQGLTFRRGGAPVQIDLPRAPNATAGRSL